MEYVEVERQKYKVESERYALVDGALYLLKMMSNNHELTKAINRSNKQIMEVIALGEKQTTIK